MLSLFKHVQTSRSSSSLGPLSASRDPGQQQIALGQVCLLQFEETIRQIFTSAKQSWPQAIKSNNLAINYNKSKRAFIDHTSNRSQYLLVAYHTFRIAINRFKEATASKPTGSLGRRRQSWASPIRHAVPWVPHQSSQKQNCIWPHQLMEISLFIGFTSTLFPFHNFSKIIKNHVLNVLCSPGSPNCRLPSFVSGLVESILELGDVHVVAGGEAHIVIHDVCGVEIPMSCYKQLARDSSLGQWNHKWNKVQWEMMSQSIVKTLLFWICQSFSFRIPRLLGTLPRVLTNRCFGYSTCWASALRFKTGCTPALAKFTGSWFHRHHPFRTIDFTINSWSKVSVTLQAQLKAFSLQLFFLQDIPFTRSLVIPGRSMSC